MFYKKHETKIWGALAIIVSIVIPLLDKDKFFPKDSSGNLDISPYVYYICCIAIITFILILLKNKSIKSGLFPSKFKTYKDVIDKTKTRYWYYGMSTETMENEAKLEEYLINSKEIPEIRIILLHPDCDNFKERISIINSELNIKPIIRAKRDLTSSLLHTINSLPANKKSKIEVRFTQTYPIWILQFIDTKKTFSEDVNQMYLKVHLSDRHSSFSKLYETNIKTDVFNSYKTYFLKEWQTAIPMTDNFEIPSLQ